MKNRGQSSQLWSVILAGGDGVRMQPMIQQWLGKPKPKQYCTFVGTRSMFQHTVDRALRLTKPERTVTVIARSHEAEAWSQLDGRVCGKVLVQPKNCGTGPGIFLPLTYIRAKEKNGTVVIYPSDHFIYPEDRFLEIVELAGWVTERMPHRPILLAAPADRLEVEYGWILPDDVHSVVDGYRLCTVDKFLEKPNVIQARQALAANGMWNMLVLVTKIETIWSLGWEFFPEIMVLFERLEKVIGTPEECTVLNAIYGVMPNKDFSFDLLQHVPRRMMALELNGVLWSDWGQPDRIEKTLAQLDKKPAFSMDSLASV
ncbi:MAG: sugar phosphate nucleotidyltransferase [Nitrospirota bacterium]